MKPETAPKPEMEPSPDKLGLSENHCQVIALPGSGDEGTDGCFVKLGHAVARVVTTLRERVKPRGQATTPPTTD